MEWIAIAIAAIAAVAAVVSAFVAWGQRKDAQDAATRADRASESAAEHAQRAADAQQQLAALAETEAARPPWTLSWARGDTYRATNIGPVTLSHVDIDSDLSIMDADHADVVHSGASIEFLAARTMSDRSTRVTVTWTDPSGQRRSWSDALPLRG